MKILFLCVANSARSQMAEGLAREMFGNEAEVFSAGSSPGTVNPFAIQALADVGIDARSHWSKAIDDIDLETMDLVITLCADEVCPVIRTKVKQLHWPFPDPASASGEERSILACFREVRDAIQRRLPELRAHFV